MIKVNDMKIITKKIKSLLILSVLLLSVNILQAENLVLNPGFEASSSVAKDWIITGPVSTMQPNTSIDSHTRFSGLYSLRMESANPNCHGRAVQSVAVKGGQTYLFSARFRTEKIKSVHKNVLIRVRWLLDKEQVGYSFIYDIAGESDGWLLASDKIKAIEKSNISGDFPRIQVEHRDSLVG